MNLQNENKEVFLDPIIDGANTVANVLAVIDKNILTMFEFFDNYLPAKIQENVGPMEPCLIVFSQSEGGRLIQNSICRNSVILNRLNCLWHSTEINSLRNDYDPYLHYCGGADELNKTHNTHVVLVNQNFEVIENVSLIERDLHSLLYVSQCVGLTLRHFQRMTSAVWNFCYEEEKARELHYEDSLMRIVNLVVNTHLDNQVLVDSIMSNLLIFTGRSPQEANIPSFPLPKTRPY